MDFSNILEIHGYNPKDVQLARHAGSPEKSGDKRTTPYSLWLNFPDRYELYCRIQKSKNFGERKFVAHFVSTPTKETMFTGFYHLFDKKPVRKSLIDPLTGEDILKRPKKDKMIVYEVERVRAFNKYEGKLFVDWGKGERAWNQIAGNSPKPVLAIEREFIEPVFPGFGNFTCMSNAVSSLHNSWQAILSANRGIYILVHIESGSQYVGSATGESGFFGRWLDYEATGHGGNKILKNLSPKEFQIGILEVSSSLETSEDILKKEEIWKKKLGSRAFADPREQGCPAAIADGADRRINRLLVRHPCGRNHHVNHAVVSDHGNDIPGIQKTDRHDRRLLGAGQLFAGHGAGPVEYDRQIDRCPVGFNRQVEASQPHLQKRFLDLARFHHRGAQVDLQLDGARARASSRQ